jgi:hypothetical protein
MENNTVLTETKGIKQDGALHIVAELLWAYCTSVFNEFSKHLTLDYVDKVLQSACYQVFGDHENSTYCHALALKIEDNMNEFDTFAKQLELLKDSISLDNDAFKMLFSLIYSKLITLNSKFKTFVEDEKMFANDMKSCFTTRLCVPIILPVLCRAITNAYGSTDKCLLPTDDVIPCSNVVIKKKRSSSTSSCLNNDINSKRIKLKVEAKLQPKAIPNDDDTADGDDDSAEDNNVVSNSDVDEILSNSCLSLSQELVIKYSITDMPTGELVAYLKKAKRHKFEIKFKYCQVLCAKLFRKAVMLKHAANASFVHSIFSLNAKVRENNVWLMSQVSYYLYVEMHINSASYHYY